MFTLQKTWHRLQGGVVVSTDIQTTVSVSLFRGHSLPSADPDHRRNAEMENEIADLRRRLTNGETTFDANGADEMNQSAEDVFYDPHSPPPSTRAQSIPVSVDQQSSPLRRSLAPPGSGESLLPRTGNAWTLEDITLSRPRIARLFEQ
jgi:hypothetical protein